MRSRTRSCYLPVKPGFVKNVATSKKVKGKSGVAVTPKPPVPAPSDVDSDEEGAYCGDSPQVPGGDGGARQAVCCQATGHS